MLKQGAVTISRHDILLRFLGPWCLDGGTKCRWEFCATPGVWGEVGRMCRTEVCADVPHRCVALMRRTDVPHSVPHCCVAQMWRTEVTHGMEFCGDTLNIVRW